MHSSEIHDLKIRYFKSCFFLKIIEFQTWECCLLAHVSAVAAGGYLIKVPTLIL